MYMKTTQLTRCLLFRSALQKQINPLTEKETFILICISVMNDQHCRCSGNTLFRYLSKIHRTPSRKDLLSIIRKFKAPDGQDDLMIRELGTGPGKNYLLTEGGKRHLFELGKKLKGVSLNQSGNYKKAKTNKVTLKPSLI